MLSSAIKNIQWSGFVFEYKITLIEEIHSVKHTFGRGYCFGQELIGMLSYTLTTNTCSFVLWD